MRSICLFISFFLFFSSSAQKISFDIFLFGNKIGQTVVERIVKNDSVTAYMLNSSSVAHIFFTTRKISLFYDVVYKRSQLISSYSKSVRNNETHITTIKWENNNYIMQRDSDAYCIKPVVECSTVKLFFSEPCNSRVFSERLGEYRSIRKTSEGVYEAEMSDGILYIYRYKNGKLVELEMKKGLLGSIFLKCIG